MSKRLKQVGMISVILLLFVCSAAFAMNKYVERVGSNYVIIAQDVPVTDAILVLGAYVLPSYARCFYCQRARA